MNTIPPLGICASGCGSLFVAAVNGTDLHNIRHIPARSRPGSATTASRLLPSHEHNRRARQDRDRWSVSGAGGGATDPSRQVAIFSLPVELLVAGSAPGIVIGVTTQWPA